MGALHHVCNPALLLFLANLEQILALKSMSDMGGYGEQILVYVFSSLTPLICGHVGDLNCSVMHIYFEKFCCMVKTN